MSARENASDADWMGGNPLAELEAVLHRTPFYRWPELRRLAAADEQTLRLFLRAEEAVRDGWSDARVVKEMRGALAAAATNIVLAMPVKESEPAMVTTYLQLAREALQAAKLLAPDLGLTPVG